MSEKENAEDLATVLLRERDRVRDEVVPMYESIGINGRPALTLVIRPAILLADEALKEHDVNKMIHALKNLRSIKE